MILSIKILDMFLVGQLLLLAARVLEPCLERKYVNGEMLGGLLELLFSRIRVRLEHLEQKAALLHAELGALSAASIRARLFVVTLLGLLRFHGRIIRWHDTIF